MKRLKRLLRRMFRPPRRIAFSREGAIFTLVTLPVGLAAINTGNNMLYLILGMMLAIIAVNGFLSESSVKNVWVGSHLPRFAYAGETLTSFVDLHNRKRWLPSYLLRVSLAPAEELPDQSGSGLQAQLPRKTDLELREGFCLKLDHDEHAKARMASVFKRRGLYRLAGVKIATRFPFGLFDKSRIFETPRDIMVYPEILPREESSGGRALSMGEIDHQRRGMGGDLYALREYQPGDDARRILWKLSLKSGHAIVREDSESGRDKVLICFDTRFPKSPPPSKKWLSRRPPPDPARQAFERTVSEVASLVHQAHESDLEVGLWTPEAAFAPERGDDQYHRLMRYLAMVEPAAEDLAATGDPAETLGDATTSVHWFRP